MSDHDPERIRARRVLIEALGGPSVLAVVLGLGSNSPVHWPRRGIPRVHWTRLIEHARKLGIREVTLKALDDTAPPNGWLNRHRRAASTANGRAAPRPASSSSPPGPATKRAAQPSKSKPKPKRGKHASQHQAD
jgi:hypothetical protein